ncbi:uncharacterized protein LOC119369107 [Jatropha curcas]|uniref:uncharacterized protein LOC119369107 n=1 Tax=Jatropha curcas TaxID=180498 RepID=UPI00189618DB|nr:uncharacterized protein LOC119369107 [Jatropha curcas]
MKSGDSLMAEETKPQGQGANSSNSASANPAAYFPQHAKSADPFLAEVKEKCTLCGDLETVFHFFESWDLAVKLRYSCNKCRICWFLGLTLEDDCGVKAQSSAPSFSSNENSRSQSQPESHNLGSLHNHISALSSATAEAPQTTANQVVQLQQVKEKCSFCGSREINFCWYESWQSDSVKIRYFCYTCERFWIQHFILVDARGSKAPSFASSFSSRENSSFQLQPQWHNLGSPQYICTTNSATAKALYITAYQVSINLVIFFFYLF